MRRFMRFRTRRYHPPRMPTLRTSAPLIVVLDPCAAEARRTRAALHRAGCFVLGAEDARTALALVPSADVLVADPRGDDDLLRALGAALPRGAVVVLYSDPARPRARPEPCRSTGLIARGDHTTLLETLADLHMAAI